ncbi:methylmalonic aciduria type A homolog, mitochondrial-like [Dysidea avara]|uniref:methylmalonic aciduria type A homolog, mitochondrial-like n=1 Tax=Dysidea avara TaxID=196820 RepID=UPI00332006AA
MVIEENNLWTPLCMANTMVSGHIFVLQLLNNELSFIRSLECDGDTMMNGGVEEVGTIKERRKEQRKTWMWSNIQWQLMQKFQHHPEVVYMMNEMEMKVMSGTISPGLAADQLLEVFKNKLTNGV